MTLKEIIGNLATEQEVKPRVAREIITKSLQKIMSEIEEGRDMRIPGVCIIRSKELKAPAGSTGTNTVRVGIMRAIPKK